MACRAPICEDIGVIRAWFGGRWVVVAGSGAVSRVSSVSCVCVNTAAERSDRLATLPTPHCQRTAADECRDPDDEPDPTPGHEALGRELRVESLQDPDRSDESDHHSDDDTDDAHPRIVGVVAPSGSPERARHCRHRYCRTMAAFGDLFERLDSDANVRGRQFEHICKWILLHDPAYRRMLRQAWVWDEWPASHPDHRLFG